jgi:hypothetical protein
MKPLFFSLLMLIASPAWAVWTFVTSDTEGVKVFVDFETLRKEGAIRKVWQISNYPPNNKTLEGSVRSRVELDCKNETVKTLSFSIFSENFSRGQNIYTQDAEQEKKSIAPDSVGWTVLKEVCKK